MDKESIFKMIKEQLKAKGLSHASVAEFLQMSRANFSHNINCKTEMSSSNFIQVLDITGFKIVHKEEKPEDKKDLMELTELLRAKRTSLEAEIEHYKEEIEYLHKRIDFFREELNKCQKKRG